MAKLGVKAWRSNAGLAPGSHMHLAPPGCPDIIGYLPDGTFLGIEVKRPGKSPTEVQLDFAQHALASKAVVFTAHSLQEAVSMLLPLLKKARI